MFQPSVIGFPTHLGGSRQVSRQASDLKLVIVVPVFNDWDAFAHLIRDIDSTVPNTVRDLKIVAVDDGSTEPIPENFSASLELQRVRSVSLVSLKCNLGHQRAIAVGLAQVADTQADAVMIMDGDGEDRPQDMRLLIDQHYAQPNHIIAASRMRRSEGFFFRLFYALYKRLFRLLTGQDISFGNFSLIPIRLVKKLLYTPPIWNHFAAAVLRSRLPLSLVPSTRGKRYAGKSKMNFVNLVVHGLSAISVFSEAMLTRILLFFVLAIGAGAVVTLTAIALRLFTGLATPGWATSVVGSVAVISLQALLLTMMSAFLVLGNRSTILPTPKQHAEDFIDHIVTLYQRSDLAQPPASQGMTASSPAHSRLSQPGTAAQAVPKIRQEDIPSVE
jgi:glycosyltransferase involved in cell wall biosynthesis